MASEVQVLTLEGVKAAARKAWDEKRLLAQNVSADDPLPTAMFATPDGHCCAIGAALSEETIATLRANGNLCGTVSGMLERGQIKLNPPGQKTMVEITEIMIAHDQIIGGRDRERQTREFLKLIDHPSAA